MAIAKRGVRTILSRAGILAGAVHMQPRVHLDMPDARCFVASERSGMLEFKER